MRSECFGKFVIPLAIVAGLTLTYPQVSYGQTGINDKVARNNGASFFANQRSSRNIQHARDYSHGIQSYTTHAQVIQPLLTQAESQMLGQQLKALERDMLIVREEHASNPKVVEQVKTIEKQLSQASEAHTGLHAECCKTIPDGKTCAEMCRKINSSLDQLKKDHDKLLKELGHQDAMHAQSTADHDHISAPAKAGK